MNFLAIHGSAFFTLIGLGIFSLYASVKITFLYRKVLFLEKSVKLFVEDEGIRHRVLYLAQDLNDERRDNRLLCHIMSDGKHPL